MCTFKRSDRKNKDTAKSTTSMTASPDRPPKLQGNHIVLHAGLDGNALEGIRACMYPHMTGRKDNRKSPTHLASP